jgi:hypothetical protein
MADFAAYVFYVNRPDFLVRAIGSFPDLQSKLVVVNNSGRELHEVLTSDECVECCFKAADVFNPLVPMTYSQSMNWMLKDAEEKEVDFIIHFHSDATSTNPDAVSQLLDYGRKMKAEGRRFGCLWTLYDVLWLLDPVACRDVGGWDTIFPDYFCDQSMKMRWKSRGWETIDTHIQGISHEGSATVNSDPELKLRNQTTFPLYSMLYQAMYGGEPGKERWLRAFGGPK